MFTRDDVEAALPELIKRANVLTELSSKISRLDHSDFEEGSSLYRGRKEDFRDAIEFWFRSLLIYDLTQEQWLNLIQRARFQPLREAEFYDLCDNDHMFYWVRLEDLPLDDEFIQAVQLDGDWNEVSVVAEFKTQYVLIYWTTGG